MRITHREVQVGDIVRCFDGAFGDAKVTRVSDEHVTLFRPWMAAGDGGYPQIGVEVFEVYRDSDKTFELMRRESI